MSDKRWRTIAVVVLAIVGFYCFSPVLDNYFFVDDYLWLAEARIAAAHFADFFDWSKQYTKPDRIFPRLLYVGLCGIGGFTPWLLYLAFILIRITTSVLLCFLLEKLIRHRAIALLVSMAFLVNYSTYETVLWTGAIGTCLGLLFYAGSLAAFLADLRTPRRGWCAACLALLLVALFSHENAVTLVPVFLIAFLAYTLSYQGRLSVQLWQGTLGFLKRYYLLVVVETGYLLYRLSAFKTQVGSVDFLKGAGLTVLKGPLVLVLPVNNLHKLISVFNRLTGAQTTMDIQRNPFLMGLAVAAAVVFLVVWGLLLWHSFRRRQAGLLLAVAISLPIVILSVAPVTMDTQNNNVFPPPRALYYPSFGLAFLVAAGAIALLERCGRRRLISWLVAVVLLGYSAVGIVITRKEERHYHHDTAIYRIIVESFRRHQSQIPAQSTLLIDRGLLDLRVVGSNTTHIDGLIRVLAQSRPPTYRGDWYHIIYLAPEEAGDFLRSTPVSEGRRPVFLFRRHGKELVMEQLR